MFKQLLRTKSLDAIIHEGEVPQHQLKRVLGTGHRCQPMTNELGTLG